ARLLFFPARLSPDYSPGVILPVTSVTPMVALGILLLAGTTVLAATLPVNRAALAAAWFLIAILPVSNLLFPVGILVAERTLYLPSVAVAIAAAQAWDAVRRARQPRELRLAAAAVRLIVVLCDIRVIDRHPAWKSTETLFAALLREHPQSYRGQWYAATQFAAAGDTLAAQDHWELAYRLWPRDALLLLEWAGYHAQHRRYERAIDLLEQAREQHAGSAFTLAPLAGAYLSAGRLSEALAVTDSLLRRTGPTPARLELRARILAQLGRREAAVATLRSALRAPDGGSWERWRLLAENLTALGRQQEAAAALDSAELAAAGDTLALKQVAEARRKIAESGV